MSVERIKLLIAQKQLTCPQCDKPITLFEKYVETLASVWDGPGDSRTETSGVKVTLICGNKPCLWRERTEYWENYIKD